MTAKLEWVQYTGSNKGSEIELIFDGDRHLVISINKGDSAEWIGNLIMNAGLKLKELNDKEDWNE